LSANTAAAAAVAPADPVSAMTIQPMAPVAIAKAAIEIATPDAPVR
jgi:hypothetical protein